MIMNWLTHVADPLPITLLYTTAAAFVISLNRAIARQLHCLASRGGVPSR